MNEVIYHCATVTPSTVISCSALHLEVALFIKLAIWVSIGLLLLVVVVVMCDVYVDVVGVLK